MQGSFDQPPIIIRTSRIKSALVILGVFLLSAVMMIALGANTLSAVLFILVMAPVVLFFGWQLARPGELTLSPEGITVGSLKRRTWSWRGIPRFRYELYYGVNGPRPMITADTLIADAQKLEISWGWELSLQDVYLVINAARLKWGDPIQVQLPPIPPSIYRSTVTEVLRYGTMLVELGTSSPDISVLRTNKIRRRLAWAASLALLALSVATIFSPAGWPLKAAAFAYFGFTCIFGDRMLTKAPSYLIASADGLTFWSPLLRTSYHWSDIKDFVVKKNHLLVGMRSTVGIRFHSPYCFDIDLGGFWERGPRELCAWLNAELERRTDRGLAPSTAGSEVVAESSRPS